MVAERIAFTLCLVFISALFGACAAVGKSECELCNTTAVNFHEGIKKTVRHNFGGGNTEWEERKLGAYARSETRLVTILEEYICDAKDDYKCHHFVEQHESDIERWWFTVFASDMANAVDVSGAKSLRWFLCVDHLKVCCDADRYGDQCEYTCSEATCNGHGRCVVDGTRSLAARKCECYDNTAGSDCEKCELGWFRQVKPGSSESSTDFDCVKCDATCVSCFEEPNNCDECVAGYEKLGPTNVCVDIDECTRNLSSCAIYGEPHAVRCLNLDGSFDCTCADGYVFDSETGGESEHVDEAKYNRKCISAAEFAATLQKKQENADEESRHVPAAQLLETDAMQQLVMETIPDVATTVHPHQHDET